MYTAVQHRDNTIRKHTGRPDSGYPMMKYTFLIKMSKTTRFSIPTFNKVIN